MTKVMVVEDHTLVRQSLVKTIDAEEGFEVVGQAGRADEALAQIGSLSPDLVLLDITIPGGDGVQVAERVRASQPETKIVFLTMHDDDASVSRAIGVGADGYVVKTAGTDELLHALRTVAAGGTYLSSEVATRVVRMGSARQARLTSRELEILRLLAKGMRPNDIAQQLYVSIKTVKNHLTSVYAKLGVKTGAQAVVEAYRQHHVPIEPGQ
jgi:DNA-binding NarL/FixJ family response regulator